MANNYINALKTKNGIDIRWGRIDNFKEKGINIQQISMLKDFFSDAEQKAIGKVSNYAKTGIGEFVAETYAGLVEGKKFSDDVIALYKKYGGPALS